MSGLRVRRIRNVTGGRAAEQCLCGNSTLSGLAEDDKAAIRLKATDLTLGLPGSRSPVRDMDLHLLSSAKLDERPFLPLVPLKDEISPSSSLKNIASGNKSSVYTEKNWMFPEGVANQYGIDLGWPPVRSFRKNTLATTCNNIDEVDG
ncbi:auxin-responsive protein IAA9-like [Brassica napus]|uniref:auxin-responsive protein IAA9-like n=1 Tax=Brassica napus TaxID=3708 RepID=UPI00207916C0|nr:auxin-responsive protein IAA9-like [Brassica napus]